MTWSELPQEYRDLEKTFDLKKVDLKIDMDDIDARFLWEKTPQDHIFWEYCVLAKTVSELPIIKSKYLEINYTEQEVLALILKFNNDKPVFFPSTYWFNKNKKS